MVSGWYCDAYHPPIPPSDHSSRISPSAGQRRLSEPPRTQSLPARATVEAVTKQSRIAHNSVSVTDDHDVDTKPNRIPYEHAGTPNSTITTNHND